MLNGFSGIRKYVILILAAVILAAPFLWTHEGHVIPGVELDHSKVGGLDADELHEVIHQKNQTLEKSALQVSYGEIREDWLFRSMNVQYSPDMYDKVMMTGRKGSVFRQWYVRWRAMILGCQIKSTVVFDARALQDNADCLVRKYSGPARDPEPLFQDDGSVKFTPGKSHLEIDEKQLIERASAAVATGRGQKIEMPVSKAAEPGIKTKDLKQINCVLGKYTTEYGGDANRNKNIELAAGKISKSLVHPGESFSFNQKTGSRTAADGYYKAPVFADGRLQDGDGGGVCQVSSTLFNAVLLAGLQVTQRASHFEAVNYVPPGRDATVAYPTIDFCFKNDLKHSVYIYCDFEPGALSVYILGNQEDRPQSVKLAKTKEEILPFGEETKIDPKQEENKKVTPGHEGKKVILSQDVIWADGRRYHDIFESVYEPVNTVITLKQ